MDVVGEIEFEFDGLTYRAKLSLDRSWEFSPGLPEEAAGLLVGRLLEIAETTGGPADGFYGARQCTEAAALMGGSVTWIAPPPERPEGLVY